MGIGWTNVHISCTNVHMQADEPHYTAPDGRKREILDAALRLIAAGGPDSLTYRRVADEAGVPLGSLTYYFEAREDLIREAFRLYIAEASLALEAVQREIPPDNPHRLADLILEIMRREFQDGMLFRAEYELVLHAARDPQVAKDYAAWERALEASLAAPLEQMGATRPQFAAKTLLRLIRGHELEQVAHRPDPPAELRERLLIVILAFLPADAARRAKLSARTVKSIVKRPTHKNTIHKGRARP
jgi:DNA-binding transcriptional regulator YbjK